MEYAKEPLYVRHNLKPAYFLRYDWTGWPTKGTIFPSGIDSITRRVAASWEKDGLRLVELKSTPSQVQILFDASPSVSPTFFCQRVKGRLQHAFRTAGESVDFSRALAFRSLGENTTDTVGRYVNRQVAKEDLADPRFKEVMRAFTVACDEVDLSEASGSGSGRYWYNLHLVLVVQGRFRITNPELLGRIRDAAFDAAMENGHKIAALSVMPDHFHVALRGNIEIAPEEIALSFQNRLAKAVGCRAWQDGFYVGTFSEYDLDAIRRIAGKS